MILEVRDPVIISALLSISVAVLHGVGLRLIRRASYKIPSERHRIIYPVFVIMSLMVLYLAEVQVFAFGLLTVGLISDPAEAFYVSASLYTTSGPGTKAIDPDWSILARAEQWVGTAMFLWTIVFLVSIRRNLFLINGTGQQRPD